MALIFALSSIEQTPPMSEGTDKDLHALLYAGLGMVLIRACAGGWRRRVTPSMVIIAVAVAFAYGVGDEFHQSFMPLRQPDPLDVAADTVGAALSASALYAWSHFIDASRRRGPV
jgi:VanZ family protein